MQSITIEQVEELANKLEAEESAERARLLRLIRGEARIAAQRSPESFTEMPLEHADEDGHYDNSYPPEKVDKDFRGPRLYEVERASYEEIATSGGYYHDWRAVTKSPGLYVARDGRIFGRDTEGTGRLGAFAAYPGDCDVNMTYEWTEQDDLSVADLREVEKALRGLAFPASVA